MTTTQTTTTLRGRLTAGTAVDDDPFAGDDDLWADEDWADYAFEDESARRLFIGLMVGLALSAVGWLAIAAAGVLVFRLVT